MVTPFQYLLLSDSPEKEEAFRKHKKLYGTTFAFHGSAIENWHGILRKVRCEKSFYFVRSVNFVFFFYGRLFLRSFASHSQGLINASGTKWMSCGAAYGNGIYLSPAAQTSLGYCGSHNYNHQYSPNNPVKTKDDGKNRYLDCNRPMLCIAICEVVNKV
jgi:poly [ADP-ribose] polymerase 6/8